MRKLISLLALVLSLQSVSFAQSYFHTYAPSVVCVGNSFSVGTGYTPNTPSGGFYFTSAQMSDASGSFASPATIGTYPYPGSGIYPSVSCGLPGYAQIGSTYKVRAVLTSTSGSPVYYGDTVSVLVDGVGTSISASTNSVCAGTPITFTATVTSGGTAPAYQWKRNGTTITGATSSTFITDTLAGNNVITYTVTGNGNCTSPITSTGDTVNITAVPATVVTIATATDTICAGTQTTFTALGTDTGSTPAYQWVRNGVNIAAATGTTYTTPALANNDTIVCKMLSSAACALNVNSNKVVMTVNPTVTPTVACSANPGTSITAGTSVILTANATNTGSTPLYQWFVNNTPVTGASTATYTSSSFANQDKVSVTMISNIACATNDTATAASLTMNVSSGIASVNTAGKAILYPNPSKGSFTVSGTCTNQAGNKYAQLTLVDVTGKTIFTDQIAVSGNTYSQAATLPSSIPSGVYSLRIELGSNVATQKFILDK